MREQRAELERKAQEDLERIAKMDDRNGLGVRIRFCEVFDDRRN